jgi:hypothetical protein
MVRAEDTDEEPAFRLGVELGRFILAAASACMLIAVSLAPAFAGPHESAASDVYSRLRPEYDPNGIRMSTLTIYPTLSSGGGLNSNVFNAPMGTQDYFYSMDAGLQVKSDWSRHKFTLDAGMQSVWYSNQVTENRDDWNLATSVTLDLLRGTELRLDGAVATKHESRGLSHPGGALVGDPSAPTEFSRNAGGLEFEHSFNRLKLTAGGTWQNLDYVDGETIGTALEINNDDRDRTEMRYFGKAAMEVWSDTAVFARAAMTDIAYAAALDDLGLQRDASELKIDGGFDFSLTHVLTGEIAAGMVTRSYQDPSLAETAGASVDIRLKWFPSMLTNVTIDGGRSIEETTVDGAASLVSTRGEVRLDHELLRNLIFSGSMGYENQEFTGGLRNDDILKGTVSGRYMINNNIHLDAGWEFVDRTSSDVPFSYSASQFQFSLTGKM